MLRTICNYCPKKKEKFVQTMFCIITFSYTFFFRLSLLIITSEFTGSMKSLSDMLRKIGVQHHSLEVKKPLVIIFFYLFVYLFLLFLI